MTRSILLSTTILMALACGGMGSEPAVTPPEPAAVEPEPAAPRPPPEPSLDGYYGYAPGHDGVHDALYATFSDGEQPYVGVDDANLRATADTSSEVVAVLPLASRVTVIESSGKPVELLDRRNEWVRVRTEEGVQGWVFGAILTPWAGEVEDQMSGEPQGTWAVTFAPDFRPRLRVQPTGSPAVGLDLTVTERFRGGRLEAATEAYGDFDTRIRVTLCRVDHGDQPECASAIAASGPEAWRQVTPPDAWRYEPDTGMGCDGGVVRAAVATTSQDVATLELPSYMRGPSTTLDCTAVGRFTEGPRAKQRVIGCTQGDGGKSDPGYLVTRWFAEESKGRWAALPCADGGTELGSELIAAFVERSIALTSDPETALGPPFVLPETLDAPRGTITRRWHALGDIAGGRVLFTAPGVGEVRETTGEFRGALAVRPPQGGTVLYQWEPDDTAVQWDDGRDPGHSESYDVGVGDCGGSLTTFQDVVVDVSDADIERVGTLSDGSVVRARRGDDGYPTVYIDDPWGRRTGLLRHDRQPPAMCEPIVYAYADPPAPVRITLGDEIEVWHADPPLTEHAWTGLALRDGSVIVDGARRRSLFWDGRSVWYPSPAQGWVVRGTEVEGELREVLPELGLRGREIDEFLEAWVPDLVGEPWVRLAFHDRATIDAVAPLHVEPPQDAIVRVYLEATPVDGPGSRERPPLPEPPPRRGRVLVEWGGVIR